MVFRLGVHQNRSEKPTDDPKDRQGACVLQHGEDTRADRDDDDSCASRQGPQDVIHSEGCIGGQIEGGDPSTLKAESIDRVRPSQAPANSEQRQAEQRDRYQSHLNRERDKSSLVGLLNQETQSYQRHQHSDLDGYIAGRHPSLESVCERVV